MRSCEHQRRKLKHRVPRLCLGEDGDIKHGAPSGQEQAGEEAQEITGKLKSALVWTQCLAQHAVNLSMSLKQI